MTDETPPQPDAADTPKTPSKMAGVARSAKAAGDGVAAVADTANNALSAIKWVAIAVVVCVLGLGGFAVYKVVSAPAKAIGDVAGGVSDAVKSGAGSVKDGASGVINRRVIPATDQAVLDRLADAAFDVVTGTPQTPAEGMKDRVFRTKNFPGSEGRICNFSLGFGGDALPIFIAADNKGYATSKSLGAKTDRLMRIMIRATGDDIAFVTEWEPDGDAAPEGAWVMKWKASTLKKPLADTDAAERVKAVLSEAATACAG